MHHLQRRHLASGFITAQSRQRRHSRFRNLICNPRTNFIARATEQDGVKGHRADCNHYASVQLEDIRAKLSRGYFHGAQKATRKTDRRKHSTSIGRTRRCVVTFARPINPALAGARCNHTVLQLLLCVRAGAYARESACARGMCARWFSCMRARPALRTWAVHRAGRMGGWILHLESL